MRRPRLARAILRAATSGDHELAEKVAAFHSRMSAMILAAMHGQAAAAATAGNGKEPTTSPATGDDDEIAVAAILQHVWFSCLIGWAGGLMGQNEVIERMGTATALLMRATHDA
jgi:hypothetical protein